MDQDFFNRQETKEAESAVIAEISKRFNLTLETVAAHPINRAPASRRERDSLWSPLNSP